METYVASTLSELGEVAKKILANLTSFPRQQAMVLTLSGELGAGKTAFVQQLGKQLGIADTMVSPTFVVMKRYQTTDVVFTNLVHIDAYRLEDEAETIPLHFSDIFAEPHTLICIEWASRIPATIPHPYATVSITDTDGVRTLSYNPPV
jgi:tRNA threonylcarbamoyladenosine biosynthesis protein TsaE